MDGWIDRQILIHWDRQILAHWDRQIDDRQREKQRETQEKEIDRDRDREREREICIAGQIDRKIDGLWIGRYIHCVQVDRQIEMR